MKLQKYMWKYIYTVHVYTSRYLITWVWSIDDKEEVFSLTITWPLWTTAVLYKLFRIGAQAKSATAVIGFISSLVISFCVYGMVVCVAIVFIGPFVNTPSDNSGNPF